MYFLVSITRQREKSEAAVSGEKDTTLSSASSFTIDSRDQMRVVQHSFVVTQRSQTLARLVGSSCNEEWKGPNDPCRVSPKAEATNKLA